MKMSKNKKRGREIFDVPTWDDDQKDLSKQFEVKQVPFLVDKKKKEEEIASRKKLKAKRTLPKKTEKDSVPPVPSPSLAVGRFVRAPSSDDDDDGINPINLGKGLKRQLSNDEDDEPMAAVPGPIRKNLIAPSAFQKTSQPFEAMEEEPTNDWKTVQNKKKKIKSMDVDDSSKNSFKNKLVDSLKGSRFRFLNEQMYKCEGKDSLKMFIDDPESFRAYHEGYRQQVEQWPSNPLNRMIKSIQKLPVNNIVIDFGCGEARLSKEVPQEVYSVDLVASAPGVVACDMANTPFKDESADVAVFCLSLMGTNLKDFLLEANRVLKVRGSLKVAEVASRFDNVKMFVQSVEKCGFQMVNQDLNNKLFYFFNFKKISNVEKTAKQVKSFSLKPCLYKKR